MQSNQKLVLKEILHARVLSEEIHGLLKGYKDDNKDKIKLSGNKSDIIENLVDAVELKIVPLEKVHEIIRDAEEYGDQYIFLYETLPKTTNTDYSNGTAIAKKVIPNGEMSKFPKLMMIPSSVEWVDFRSPNRGLKDSWMMKLYDRKTREVKQDEDVKYSEGLRIVTYKTKEFRLIYIVEWTGKNLLEFKIGRTTFDSNRSLSDSLKKLRTLVGNGINVQKDFKKYDLSQTIANIIDKSEDNKKIYNLLATNLQDSQGGTAQIRTYGEDSTDLLEDDSRKAAVDAYVSKKGKATGVSISFLESGSEGVLSKDIIVTLGKDDINQIIISANVTPQEYNYVRRKIKSLG